MSIVDFNATAWGIPANGFPGIPAPAPIQNGAVEVAARTWFERVTGCDWDDEPEQSKRGFLGDARAALAAVVAHGEILAGQPRLLEIWAEAWDEGCEMALMHKNPKNPYRTAK